MRWVAPGAVDPSYLQGLRGSASTCLPRQYRRRCLAANGLIRFKDERFGRLEILGATECNLQISRAVVPNVRHVPAYPFVLVQREK